MYITLKNIKIYIIIFLMCFITTGSYVRKTFSIQFLNLEIMILYN